MGIFLKFCRHQELRLQQQISGPTHTSQSPQILYKRHWQYAVSLRCVWRESHRCLQIKPAHPNRILRVVHFWDNHVHHRSLLGSPSTILSWLRDAYHDAETNRDILGRSTGIFWHHCTLQLHVVSHNSLIALFSTYYLDNYFNLLARLFCSLKFTSQNFDKISYDNMIITDVGLIKNCDLFRHQYSLSNHSTSRTWEAVSIGISWCGILGVRLMW